MTKTVDAIEIHSRIEREAVEKAVPELRFVGSIDLLQHVRQGDIYIHRVADDHPHGKRAESNQLAVGDTQGARHVAESTASVYVGTALPPLPEIDPQRLPLLGPCIVADDRFTITHPEHAHVSLPAGVYQVTHQMDARTFDRVRD